MFLTSICNKFVYGCNSGTTIFLLQTAFLQALRIKHTNEWNPVSEPKPNAYGSG